MKDGTIVAYEWVSDRDGALGNDSEVVLSTLTEGAHRISLRVQDDSGHWSGWVHKHLYVTDRIVTEAEYNDDIEQAYPVPLSTWITGRIYPRNEDDFYKIYLEQRGYLFTLVDAVPADMRAAIAFYDGNGDYMYRTASANNFGDWFYRSDFLEAGWYYVRVDDRTAGAMIAPTAYGSISRRLRTSMNRTTMRRRPRRYRPTTSSAMPASAVRGMRTGIASPLTRWGDFRSASPRRPRR